MLGRMVLLVVLAGSVQGPAGSPPRRGEASDALLGRGSLSVRLAELVLSRWPDPKTISGKGWEYSDGIVLRGLAAVYRRTGDPRYLAYIRRWVDAFVREDGSIALGEEGHNLDRVQPGVLLLLLHDETGEERYARSARWLRARFERFPRNAEGGFWHKQKYPNEMWLDGLYMAEPFLAGYARRFGDVELGYATAVEQITLAAKHTLDPATGLHRHAWDADGNAEWADPRTGASPEAWGRAMGWFLMALVDVLEELPESQRGQAELRALFGRAAGAVRAVQDPQTGLWRQVLDKGERSDNWFETSASAMFVYAFETGAKRGLLDPTYRAAARRGWEGLLKTLESDDRGRPVVRGAVEGMGVQRDLAGYLGKRRLENSPHGICAMLLAAAGIE